MSSSRPNIVFIATDQQHIDTLSAYGCPYVSTSAMDELATTGTSFFRSYTTHPVCLPARASWFTGRMPSETGVYDESKALRPGLATLGQWLRDEAGYQSVYTGKWHVPKYIPAAHDDVPGFETIFTGISGQGFVMDSGVSMACEAYLRNVGARREEPFLLVASFMNPHDICEWQFQNSDDQPVLRFPAIADELPPLPPNFDPPRPEPAIIEGFRQNLDPHVGGWSELHWRYYLWSYYRHVEMLDAEIGRIVGALRETGLDRETIVVLSSDHGEGLGHHAMTHKLFPYDEVCRVPFIVAWPGTLPEGRRDDQSLVSGLDLMPTLCDFAGAEPPPKMRGVSLRPTLESRDPLDRDFVPMELFGVSARVIRSRRWKYATYADDPVEQLFDLEADPGESVNVAGEPCCAAVLAEHRELLAEWFDRLDRPR
jgi:arylsulfatase A-like enzyme